MTFQRAATAVLFLTFLGLGLWELVPKWQAAAQRQTDSVLYVRSVKQPPAPAVKKKAVSYDSILNANSRNKDG